MTSDERTLRIWGVDWWLRSSTRTRALGLLGFAAIGSAAILIPALYWPIRFALLLALVGPALTGYRWRLPGGRAERAYPVGTCVSAMVHGFSALLVAIVACGATILCVRELIGGEPDTAALFGAAAVACAGIFVPLVRYQWPLQKPKSSKKRGGGMGW